MWPPPPRSSCCYWLAIMAVTRACRSNLVGRCHLLLSAAELLLSPLGMSLITRIAPPAKDVAGGRAVVRGGSSRQRIGGGHRLALGTLAESPLLRTAGGRVARGRSRICSFACVAFSRRSTHKPTRPRRKRRSPCPVNGPCPASPRSLSPFASRIASAATALRLRRMYPKCLRFPATGQQCENDQTMPKSARAWPL